MASCERGGLVEEEQLRVTTGCHELRPMSAAKLQPTSDPSLCSIQPANRSGVVMKAPTIAVDEASLVGRDHIRKGRDTVLMRHTPRLAPSAPPPRPATRLRAAHVDQKPARAMAPLEPARPSQGIADPRTASGTSCPLRPGRTSAQASRGGRSRGDASECPGPTP
jgi:hypothetical protein